MSVKAAAGVPVAVFLCRCPVCCMLVCLRLVCIGIVAILHVSARFMSGIAAFLLVSVWLVSELLHACLSLFDLCWDFGILVSFRWVCIRNCSILVYLCLDCIEIAAFLLISVRFISGLSHSCLFSVRFGAGNANSRLILAVGGLNGMHMPEDAGIIKESRLKICFSVGFFVSGYFFRSVLSERVEGFGGFARAVESP